MAQTLAQIRAKTRTSIHGRQLGLDRDFLGGIKDHRRVVTNITTAGSVLPNHGFVTLSTTASSVAATLASPEPGVSVWIGMITAGTTNSFIVTSASTAATITSTAGTADTRVTFTGVGAQTQLMGVSTAVWVQMGGASTDVSKAVAS
jgi:hypothetical protein